MADAARVDGESGLLVPVPEAEAVIGPIRARHDPAARMGVPAHVTVLFPFVPRAEIDEVLRAEIGRAFATCRPFDYRFARVERFDEGTVFLAPEPADAFAQLTDAAVRRWPEHPPYGGAFDVVVPHLTLGDDLAPGEADRLTAEAERALARHGPISGRATTVTLMIADRGGRWSVDGRWPLGAGTP